MQATWPASLTLYENFTYFAERVDKLSAGALKIEAMPAGQVVPAFEVLDATHKKVLDGPTPGPATGPVRTRPRSCSPADPAAFGMDYIDVMGWMYNGGGLEFYNEFYQKELKLNVVVFPILPSGPQAFGWFKKPIQTVEDMKGMKCRQTGMAGEVWQALGFTVVNIPGGEIIPSAQRGVIDCAEWSAAWRTCASASIRVEVSLYAGRARECHYRRAADQRRRVEIADAAASGDRQVGGERDLPGLVGQVAEAERRRRQGDAGEARRAGAAHPARHPAAVPEEVGRDRGRGRAKNPFFKKVHDSQKA